MPGLFSRKQAADPHGPATSYKNSRVGTARHAVEQELVVEYFAANPTALIDDITEEFGLAALFGNLYRQAKVRKHPYYADQYALDMKKMESGDYLIIAELPHPEHLGLCYRMFFTFDAAFQHVALFTVEREEEGAALYLRDRTKTRTCIGHVQTGPWSRKSGEERAQELQMVADAYHALGSGEGASGHAAAGL